MKELAIISGKGGTGKTTVTAALSRLLDNKILVDCDVDAANLHLVLEPKTLAATDFYSGKKAELAQELCKECGACRKVCRFEAIDSEYGIDDLSCTGCGACSLVCPTEAITLHENLAGKWYVSETPYGPMVHAKLGIAEDNSGKLVSKIRDVAKRLAEQQHYQTIIIDGPPGIGCPVISAITGVDAVLAVTEPTLSGLHDLRRVLTLTGNFGIKSLVCINKYDLNAEVSAQIAEYCTSQGVQVVSKIPFNREVVEGMVSASTEKSSFVDNFPAEVKTKLENLKEILIREIS